MMHRTVVGLFAVCALGACKDDEGDVETAAEGWRAASLAMEDGQEQFESEVEIGAEGSITATCPEGGQIAIDGRMEDLSIYELEIAFDGCQSDGVKIDGDLSMSGTVRTTETSAEVTFDYTGHIEFSGDVEMSCTIDASGRVAASSNGEMSSAEVSFSGHICGADANAVVRASA